MAGAAAIYGEIVGSPASVDVPAVSTVRTGTSSKGLAILLARASVSSWSCSSSSGLCSYALSSMSLRLVKKASRACCWYLGCW